MQKNSLIRKIRLISKFVTSQPGKQTIPIHILSIISKSKSNQTMKFGQLIEYNMRNIFLEKLFTKYYGETNPRPFSKKSKLRIYLDQQCMLKLSMLKLSCRPLAFTSYKAFYKTKRSLELDSLPHFLHDF